MMFGNMKHMNRADLMQEVKELRAENARLDLENRKLATVAAERFRSLGSALRRIDELESMIDENWKERQKLLAQWGDDIEEADRYRQALEEIFTYDKDFSRKIANKALAKHGKEEV